MKNKTNQNMCSIHADIRILISSAIYIVILILFRTLFFFLSVLAHQIPKHLFRYYIFPFNLIAKTSKHQETNQSHSPNGINVILPKL